MTSFRILLLTPSSDNVPMRGGERKKKRVKKKREGEEMREGSHLAASGIALNSMSRKRFITREREGGGKI